MALTETEIAGGVATVWLNRPDKRNALDGALMQAIAGALDAVRDDASVRVVLLRGRGAAFSSGIDHHFLLEVFQKSQSMPFAHLHHDLQEVFHRLERMQKPTIAAMHRACVGMAFELALACDFRVATEDCVLGLPEIAFGIVPDVGGTTRLVRAVGPVRAREMILSGRLLAARDGGVLVSELATDENDLATKATALANHIAALPPAAVGQAKQLVVQSGEVDARTSFQLEGTVQQILMRQKDLAEHFPRALAFIKEEMERARGGRGAGR